MGLFLRQDGGRSELQTKVATDVRERMAKRTALGGDVVDFDDLEKPSESTRNDAVKTAAILAAIAIFLLSVIALFIFLR